MADAGPVPAKVVADRLGHSSVLVTLDRYSHVKDEDRKAAADLGSRMVGVRLAEIEVGRLAPSSEACETPTVRV